MGVNWLPDPPHGADHGTPQAQSRRPQVTAAASAREGEAPSARPQGARLAQAGVPDARRCRHRHEIAEADRALWRFDEALAALEAALPKLIAELAK
jgi:hypothetical protein